VPAPAVVVRKALRHGQEAHGRVNILRLVPDDAVETAGGDTDRRASESIASAEARGPAFPRPRAWQLRNRGEWCRRGQVREAIPRDS